MLSTDHYTEGVVVNRDGTIFFSMTRIAAVDQRGNVECDERLFEKEPSAIGLLSLVAR
ncbi:MAG: hypothetical protein M3154_02725 [Candidatus Eremiobacteraeota bacterium]|nr:hypothetical protein [Candidatus Eremiobacteraeota bacterium]